MEVLSEHGAHVFPDSHAQTLYVNHSKVLVRTSHTHNDCMCIELLHETVGNRWSRSWGITSDADWLLHVDCTGAHYWYKLPRLKEHISNMVVKDELHMSNNSQRLRNSGNPSTNVVSVWINKVDNTEYVYATNDYAYSSSYEGFLNSINEVYNDAV